MKILLWILVSWILLSISSSTSAEHSNSANGSQHVGLGPSIRIRILAALSHFHIKACNFTCFREPDQHLATMSSLMAEHGEMNGVEGSVPAQDKRYRIAEKSAETADQRSAALRVLGCPELLETVLSCGHGYNPKPSIIFPLQRVNRFWAAVIAESPSLRQIMSLEHSPRSYRSPMNWFLDNVGMRPSPLLRGKDAHRQRTDVYRPTKASTLCGSGGGDWGLSQRWLKEPNASWRAIKAFPYCGPQTRSACLVIRLSDLWTHLSFMYTRRIANQEYSRTFTPGEDATLGEVYEWFRETVLVGKARCEAMADKERVAMKERRMLAAKGMDDASWFNDF